MTRLSLSRAWDECVRILRRDGSLLATVALALIVLPEIIFAVVGTPIGANATSIAKFVYVGVILLGFVANIALNRLAIGPSVTVGTAIREAFIRFTSVFVAFVIVILGMFIVAVLIAVLLGATGVARLPTSAGQPPPASLVLLLLTLVVLVFAMFQLIFPISAAETGNPIKLLTRSWQLAKGQYWRLLAYTVTIFVGFIAVIVACQFGIGSMVVLLLGRPNPGSLAALILGLVTGVVQATYTVVISVMLARIYLQLAGRDGAQVSVPSSGI